jgi:hypothetical protein
MDPVMVRIGRIMPKMTPATPTMASTITMPDTSHSTNVNLSSCSDASASVASFIFSVADTVASIGEQRLLRSSIEISSFRVGEFSERCRLRF